MSVKPTMQGIAIDSFSKSTEVESGKLQMKTFSIGKPGKGEVLVKVYASGLNPVDRLIQKGTFPLPLPITLGVDLSGRVTEIGEDVTKFKVGDEVFAHTQGQVGTFAEFAVLPQKLLALKPKSISHIEASAVPCVALTAYQALTKVLKIKKGETVLITGGAGGVGSFAVQIAAALGAHVITTGSEKNREYLLKLGAKDVVDYTKGDYTKKVRELFPGGVKYGLTTVSGQTKMDLIKAVEDNGKLLWISSEDKKGPEMERGITGDIFYAEASGSSLEEIAELIDSGKVGVHVQDVVEFSVKAVAEALDLLDKGHVRGKLVVKITGDEK